jgi:fructosamine-3-kinase
MPGLAERIEPALGARPTTIRPLSGGCVGDVSLAELPSGERIVAKAGDAGSGLEVEGMMLRHLKDPGGLPVPDVLYAGPSLLLMTFVETSGGIDASAQEDAAHHLARLHGVTRAAFGFDEDTVIAQLRQPNGELASWRTFFRDRRLLYMAEDAHAAGRLPTALRHRIDTLAARLDDWIADDGVPGLVHGDMWGGNVLTRGGKIAAFVDPAIYYADTEIELAFSTMFGTFGDPFFRRYDELAGLRPGFFEERRDLYNLWPLLVHVRLFGGGYVASVARTLERYGC